MTTECRCGKPTRDNAELCDGCYDELGYALVDIPFVAQELETTFTRQRASAISGGSPSAETGLPYHARAGDAIRDLHSLLVSWVRFCAEEGVSTANLPADEIGPLADWLFKALPRLKFHDIATEAHDEITDAVADARRLVFWKRKNRVYLGTCRLPVVDDEGATTIERCPGEVYADEGKPVGLCDECEQGHTVVIRRAELEKELDDRLFTAAEIGHLSTHMGLPVGREQVRKRIHYWKRHGRILPAGSTEDGDPRFRYREVRILLAAEYAERDTHKSA